MVSTIKDVALEAGVSISMVSRVMNNSGYVSENNKQKVMEAVAKCNYIPNTNAQNLKSYDAKTIGVFVKGIHNPFFNKMIGVIEEKIALKGYSLILHNVADTQDEMNLAIIEKTKKKLSGVILIGGKQDYTEENFKKLQIPCVLTTISANENVSRELYSSVRIDDMAEGYKATEYLISLGHKKIGFIFSSALSNEVTPNTQRFRGYLKALEDNNIPIDKKLIATIFQSSKSGYTLGFELFKNFYDTNCGITAVFCFADVLAIGAAKAATAMGLNIPGDVSILGFDGIEMTEFYNPSIDTVYQPASEMAMSSIDFLFEMINGGKAQHKIYECNISRRGSCKNINL